MTDLEGWSTLCLACKKSHVLSGILAFIEKERREGKQIFPKDQDVFNAFKLCAFRSLKVVILGQDPYHNLNQAHGLAFSVQHGVKLPPSLVNIYKELKGDLAIMPSSLGDLTAWARQGVFLLNTVLTVEAHKAHSHANMGWEKFTDYVIGLISKHKKNIVFMLWGAPAQKKSSLIDASKHLILKASHPSPLSAHRGFFGCQHFSQANSYLQLHHEATIDWQVG